MRTVKITLVPEPRDGFSIKLEIDAIVSSVEDAEEQGVEAGKIATAFLQGFSESHERPQ